MKDSKKVSLKGGWEYLTGCDDRIRDNQVQEELVVDHS